MIAMVTEIYEADNVNLRCLQSVKKREQIRNGLLPLFQPAKAGKRLFLALLQSFAKDVAKACTRVGRTILLNGLLLFGQLKGLD
jgi:hypothetical protein